MRLDPNPTQTDPDPQVWPPQDQIAQTPVSQLYFLFPINQDESGYSFRLPLRNINMIYLCVLVSIQNKKVSTKFSNK